MYIFGAKIIRKIYHETVIIRSVIYPALLFAQEDQHYLAGAVPVADGKVVFTREINAPSLSKAQSVQRLLNGTRKF